MAFTRFEPYCLEFDIAASQGATVAALDLLVAKAPKDSALSWIAADPLRSGQVLVSRHRHGHSRIYTVKSYVPSTSTAEAQFKALVDAFQANGWEVAL